MVDRVDSSSHRGPARESRLSRSMFEWVSGGQELGGRKVFALQRVCDPNGLLPKLV